MKLTKEELNGVKFKAKGTWYSGEEVDDFIDEIILEVEKENLEKKEMEKKLKFLQELIEKISSSDEDIEFPYDVENLSKPKNSKEKQRKTPVFDLVVYDELIKTRNKLIDEIKLLKKEKNRLEKS